jgi:DNA repair exonuclease SbcCD nuclease subunit
MLKINDNIKQNKLALKKKLSDEKEQLKQEKLLEKEQLKQEKEQLKQEKLLEKQEKSRQKKLAKDTKDLIDKELEKKQEDTLTNTVNLLIDKQSINSNNKPIFQIISPPSEIVIKKIIHIADIHIRLSTRHAEYNKVFEEFYNELKIIVKYEPNCIVCLCGDLLESKDELKPDTILHTWNFLKNISQILPLIIISGNHDRIEQNDNKYDSIQAILDDRPITNIYYLQYTGVYIFNNIIFGINSIVDKLNLHIDQLNSIITENTTDIYNKYKQSEIKKVCLYHGAVENAKNNFSFIIPGARKLSDFGQYDYILLGDIHKFQYLNSEKNIAYCSSMISQNMSETDKYHGFLEWNILDGKSKYHILSNSHAFHKININEIIDTNYKLDIKLLEKNLSYIIGGTLKIESDEYYEDLIDKNSIKYQIEKFNPKISVWIAITYDCNKSIKPNDDIDISNVNTNIDILDTETSESDIIDTNLKIKNDQMDILIVKYLKERENISDDNLINVIIKYFKNITIDHSLIKTQSKYFNKEWKILWLSFDYMFGYGPNNVIDFTLYPNNEIIGILGDNAIGKSSLIDIITFLLFHKTCRDDTLKDIININSNKSQGIIIFESGKQKYMIQKLCYRDIRKKTQDSKLDIKMTMYEMNLTDNKNCFPLHGQYFKLVSLTEKDRHKTTDTLEILIGDLQNFILTSVLLQGNYGTFKSKDNKQKKEFLCKILNIDHFSNCEKDIIDHYKKLKNQYATINRSLENTSNMSIEEFNDKIKFLKEQTIPVLIDQTNYNDIEIIKLEKKISDLQCSLIIEDNDCIIKNNIDLDDVNKNISILSKQLNDLILENNYYLEKKRYNFNKLY